MSAICECRASGTGIDLPIGTNTGRNRPIFVGDEIENPGNVAGLRAAAAMFDWECAFTGGIAPEMNGGDE